MKTVNLDADTERATKLFMQLVVLPSLDRLDVLSGIYEFCAAKGYRPEGEAIRVGAWPGRGVDSKRGSSMNEIERLLERQARWQRSRRALSWPEKIRMAEQIRASVEQWCSRAGRKAVAGRNPGNARG